MKDDSIDEVTLAAYMERGLDAPGIVVCERCSMWPRDDGLHVSAMDVAIIGKFDNDVARALLETNRAYCAQRERNRIEAQAKLLGLSFKTTDLVDDYNLEGHGTREIIMMLRGGSIRFPKEKP